MTIFNLITIALPIALGVAMIGAGGVNFAGPSSVRESFNRWGYPAGFHRVIGGFEVMSGLLLLVPQTSRLGAVGSALILLAAVATLIRFRQWGHLPGALILTAATIATLA